MMAQGAVSGAQAAKMGPSNLLGIYQALYRLALPQMLLILGSCVAMPAVPDIAVGALCDGKNECSRAVYISAMQSAFAGAGSVLVTPLVGGLSDKYGRKPFLVTAFFVSLLPNTVLAISTSKAAVYVYYCTRCISDVIGLGTTSTLMYAYVADVIPQAQRATAFGVLMGNMSGGLLLGTIVSRFVSERHTFQVAVSLMACGAVLVCFLLKDVKPFYSLLRTRSPAGKAALNGSATEGAPAVRAGEPAVVAAGRKDAGGRGGAGPTLMRSRSTIRETINVVATSRLLTYVVLISFLNTLGDMGQMSSLMFVLKSRFQFAKNQFSELMIFGSICSITSMLVLLPTFIPLLGVRGVLSFGIFFDALHDIIYGIAWAEWVPFLACSFYAFSAMTNPAIGSIVSLSASAEEQGTLQGVVMGSRSLANIIAPIALSPINALFLSDDAPFKCKGFGLILTGLLSTAALVLTFMMPQLPTTKEAGQEYVSLTSSEEEARTDHGPDPEAGGLAPTLPSISQPEMSDHIP